MWKFIPPIIVIIFSFLAGLLAKNTLIKRISRLAKRTKSQLDDILIESLRPVVVLWSVLLGVYIAINISPLTSKEVDFLQKVFLSLLVFSIFWFLVRLLGKVFLVYSDKLQEKIVRIVRESHEARKKAINLLEEAKKQVEQGIEKVGLFLR